MCAASELSRAVLYPHPTTTHCFLLGMTVNKLLCRCRGGGGALPWRQIRDGNFSHSRFNINSLCHAAQRAHHGGLV
jgi:hypothetical protein